MRFHLLRIFVLLFWGVSNTTGCMTQPVVISTPSAPIVLKTIPIKADAYNSVARLAVNPRSGNVYLSLGTHVTILNGIDIVADIPTGQLWAEDIAVDSVNDWDYVVNQNSDSVTVMQGTRVIQNVALSGSDPWAVAVVPDSQWAYIVSTHATRVDGKLGKVEGNIMVLLGPNIITNINVGALQLTHVVADPIYGYVYVGDAGGDVIVLKGLQEVARFSGVLSAGYGASVQAMDADTRPGEVYVVDSSKTIRKFKEGKLVSSVQIGNPNDTTWTAMRVHPQSGNIYLVASRSNTRQAVVLRDGKEIAHLPVGHFPLDLKIDPFTGNVYISNFYDGTVTAINGIEELDTITIGLHASAIGINPNNGWVYVVDTLQQTVSVLGNPPAKYAPLPTRNVTTVPSAPTIIPTKRSYP
jgi:DNA-binding beta-propeller fold protein YncE